MKVTERSIPYISKAWLTIIPNGSYVYSSNVHKIMLGGIILEFTHPFVPIVIAYGITHSLAMCNMISIVKDLIVNRFLRILKLPEIIIIGSPYDVVVLM